MVLWFWGVESIGTEYKELDTASDSDPFRPQLPFEAFKERGARTLIILLINTWAFRFVFMHRRLGRALDVSISSKVISRSTVSIIPNPVSTSNLSLIRPGPWYCRVSRKLRIASIYQPYLPHRRDLCEGRDSPPRFGHIWARLLVRGAGYHLGPKCTVSTYVQLSVPLQLA